MSFIHVNAVQDLVNDLIKESASHAAQAAEYPDAKDCDENDAMAEAFLQAAVKVAAIIPQREALEIRRDAMMSRYLQESLADPSIATYSEHRDRVLNS